MKAVLISTIYVMTWVVFVSCGPQRSIQAGGGGGASTISGTDNAGATGSSTITRPSTGGTSTGSTTGTSSTTSQSTVPNFGEKAYLHVNLWDKFHNFRSWCGTEKTFAWQCRNIKQKYPAVNCDAIEKKAQDCLDHQISNPSDVEYGFVGFEKQDAEHQDLCHGSLLDDDGGCDYRRWDLDNRLRFYWYGPRWAGNWPVSTLKIFQGYGKKSTDTGEVIGLSNRQNTKDRESSGVDRGGKRLGIGCVLTHSDGQNEYQAPFGAFAWIEVPVGVPVTVTGAVGAIFAGDFSAFGRDGGSAPVRNQTMAPSAYWAANPPNGGPRVGYSVYTEEVVFEKGKQYYWGHGSIEEVNALPADIQYGFNLLSPQKSVAQPSDCQ